MFTWTHLGSSITDTQPTVYRLNGTEIARLWQHVQTRDWWATLDKHLPFERQRNRACQSYQTGRAGVEQWALRHLDRLTAEVAEIEARRPVMPWLPKAPR